MALFPPRPVQKKSILIWAQQMHDYVRSISPKPSNSMNTQQTPMGTAFYPIFPDFDYSFRVYGEPGVKDSLAVTAGEWLKNNYRALLRHDKDATGSGSEVYRTIDVSGETPGTHELWMTLPEAVIEYQAQGAPPDRANEPETSINYGLGMPTDDIQLSVVPFLGAPPSPANTFTAISSIKLATFTITSERTIVDIRQHAPFDRWDNTLIPDSESRFDGDSPFRKTLGLNTGGNVWDDDPRNASKFRHRWELELYDVGRIDDTYGIPYFEPDQSVGDGELAWFICDGDAGQSFESGTRFDSSNPDPPGVDTQRSLQVRKDALPVGDPTALQATYPLDVLQLWGIDDPDGNSVSFPDWIVSVVGNQVHYTDPEVLVDVCGIVATCDPNTIPGTIIQTGSIPCDRIQDIECLLDDISDDVIHDQTDATPGTANALSTTVGHHGQYAELGGTWDGGVANGGVGFQSIGVRTTPGLGTSSRIAIDLVNSHLHNAAGNVVLDWEPQILSAIDGSDSIRWQQRQLKNAAGTVVFDWATQAFTLTGLTINGSTAINAGNFTHGWLTAQETAPTDLVPGATPGARDRRSRLKINEILAALKTVGIFV